MHDRCMLMQGGRNGRAAHTRFMEVEMPLVAARPLVVERERGWRILLMIDPLLVNRERSKEYAARERPLRGCCYPTNPPAVVAAR